MTEVFLLDQAWRFRRILENGNAEKEQLVDLPHCPFIADINGKGHWFGECEYRRDLDAPIVPEARYVLYIGAAMQTAKVLIDGEQIAQHAGGYLPFEVDLTEALRGGKTRRLTLRLDNRSAPEVPPGKPFEELDFCWYGGLYRSVELRIYPSVHLTDPVGAGEIAGGGVFLRTLEASGEAAQLYARVHVCNRASQSREVHLFIEVKYHGELVARGRNVSDSVPPHGSLHLETEIHLTHPRLWSPAAPHLYDVTVRIHLKDQAVCDVRSVGYGIRRIHFSRSRGFTINGERRRLRGTNRHQEYPFCGYALPRAAQFRDARKIKEAGFDYVRLSHYPQSPDFLDACDQLGIVVLNCIPGWQFLGDDVFRRHCFQVARDLIRRDRNHACVVAWELSLNETEMDRDFIGKLHSIGHEEYPGDQMYTAGWIDHYDLFLHSRQHGEIHRWKNGDKALIIAEYGDWEFYASNGGFDQGTGAGVHAAWSNSRQFRGSGERALRQQAWNHIIALNDTLSSAAVLDGQWAMFDYARGYHPVRAAVGVMDIYRLPKFSYYLYRSQRDAGEGEARWSGGPLVYIASHWLPTSDLRIIVFSNCDEVVLLLNGTTIGREYPSKAWMTQHLPHPPFIFDLPGYDPGNLEAVGLIDGVSRASQNVRTPGKPALLQLIIDEVDLARKHHEQDLVFAHAQICDFFGTLCVEDHSLVAFDISEGAEILGPRSVSAEAGIASVLIRVPADVTYFALAAQSVIAETIIRDSVSWGAVHPPAIMMPAAVSDMTV